MNNLPINAASLTNGSISAASVTNRSYTTTGGTTVPGGTPIGLLLALTYAQSTEIIPGAITQITNGALNPA